ncbi:MAG TPA: hypothetical protein VG897_03035 [Terriglobales bacterium]|nr:hypothetical protein [Terriglobales bacterium]
MQIHFTHDELKLVAEILEAHLSSSDEAVKKASYSLFDRVISHDFRFAFDELEDLQDILTSYQTSLHDQIATVDQETKPGLIRKAELLEAVMGKVTEACAMV